MEYLDEKSYRDLVIELDKKFEDGATIWDIESAITKKHNEDEIKLPHEVVQYIKRYFESKYALQLPKKPNRFRKLNLNAALIKDLGKKIIWEEVNKFTRELNINSVQEIEMQQVRLMGKIIPFSKLLDAYEKQVNIIINRAQNVEEIKGVMIRETLEFEVQEGKFKSMASCYVEVAKKMQDKRDNLIHFPTTSEILVKEDYANISGKIEERIEKEKEDRKQFTLLNSNFNISEDQGLKIDRYISEMKEACQTDIINRILRRADKEKEKDLNFFERIFKKDKPKEIAGYSNGRDPERAMVARYILKAVPAGSLIKYDPKKYSGQDFICENKVADKKGAEKVRNLVQKSDINMIAYGINGVNPEEIMVALANRMAEIRSVKARSDKDDMSFPKDMEIGDKKFGEYDKIRSKITSKEYTGIPKSNMIFENSEDRRKEMVKFELMTSSNSEKQIKLIQGLSKERIEDITNFIQKEKNFYAAELENSGARVAKETINVLDSQIEMLNRFIGIDNKMKDDISSKVEGAGEQDLKANEKKKPTDSKLKTGKVKSL